MSKRITTILLLFLFITSSVISQEVIGKKEEKLLMQKGEAYYNDEYYQTAATIFERLNKTNPKDLYYKLMVGICYTFINDKKEQSLDYLLDVQKSNPEYVDVYFFIGRAYAVNHQFDEAVKNFNKYIQSSQVLPEDKVKARLFVENCKNAKTIVPDSLELVIENIGPPINTKFEEYVPIITPDERLLIFTYRGERSVGGRMDRAGNSDPNGEYYEDIMISYKRGNEWSEPKSIGNNINTRKHDASIALSANGRKLFTYRSSNKNEGDIYLSELEDGSFTTPRPLNSEINSEAWEGSASLTSDERTLYFTSEREGGYGGRDIYKAELLDNGDWGNVINLGPSINTRYDEDAPFIHPDNKTLYFSSKGHNSIGGYDIFYTYNDDGVWDSPENIGYPVNTIEDDKYYVLTADGTRGYYSSAGKSDTYGGNDIYVVSPGHFGKRPILALIVGVTKLNGKATTAEITATDAATGEFANQTISDGQSGKFMISLIPGNKYKIAIEIEGAKTTYEYIDVESVETFVQVNHNIDLYNEDFTEESKVENESKINLSLQEKLMEQITRIKEFANDSIEYEKIDLNQRIQKLERYNKEVAEDNINDENTTTGGVVPAGNKEIAGLSFKVEVGAVKDTNDFKLADLKKYGKISRKLYDDGYYRYTFGRFETLEHAENFRDMMVEKEPTAKDAFITVFVFGKRKTVDEFTEEFTLEGLGNEVEEVETFVAPDLSTTATEAEIKKAQPIKSSTEITMPDEQITADEKKAEEKMKIMTDPCDKYTMEAFTAFVLKDIDKEENYKRLLSLVGPICHPDLHFEVQIGAYRKPNNFKYNKLLKFGNPQIRNYQDEITRFTQGEFKTFYDAEGLRQKVITEGTTDAWITPFYKGKRLLMQDLVKGNYESALGLN
jgi:hypothetical protein